MTRRISAAFCAVLGACLTVWPHTAAAETDSTRKVVIVVANRVLLDDLASRNFPVAAAPDVAIGLISPDCAGFKSEASITLTAAAGRACRGGSFVRDCYDSDELLPGGVRAAAEYERRTGFEAREGSAVFLGLGPALRANPDIPPPVRLGIIGDSVRSQGGRTCVTGNADVYPDRIDRSAAVLAADSSGLVDIGRLRWTNGETSRSPDGVSVPSPDELAEAVRRAVVAADLIVVDFGCLRALDDLQMIYSEDVYALRRGFALLALSRLVENLLRDARRGKFDLVVVSLSPPSDSTGKRLTPVLIFSERIGRGLLSSPTTRTPGLVAASDFAPTVLSLMGITGPDHITGRAATAAAGRVRMLEALQELDKRVAAYGLLMAPVLWVFAGLGALGLAGAALVLSFPRSAGRRFRSVVSLALLAVAVSPLAMLLAVLVPAGAVWHASAIAAGLVVPVIVLRRMTASRAVVAAFTLTSGVVLIDAACGGILCRFALPSSYQLSGLRYYGIGNEYAGVLISMAALAWALGFAPGPGRWRFSAAGGVLITGILASGAMGANYGGAVTSAVTFGLLTLALKKGRFGARHALGFAVVGAAAVVLMALVESWLARESGSHAARLARITEASGWAQAAAIAGRKMLLNLRLALSDTAVKAYLMFVPFVFLWFVRLRELFLTHYGADPRLTAAFKAVCVGAVTAVLLNDSGIVMGGIMLSMAAVVVSYSLLHSAPECRQEDGGRCPES